MSEKEPPFDEVVRLIKQQRDELKLKIHLGGKDALDEWDKLEAEWDELKEAIEPLGAEAKEVARDAGEKASELSSDFAEDVPQKLRASYEKLRKMLK